jgi:hypothetical protein
MDTWGVMRLRTQDKLGEHEPSGAKGGRHIANRPAVVLITLLCTVVTAATGLLLALRSQDHPVTDLPSTVSQATAVPSTEPPLASTTEPGTEGTSPTQRTSGLADSPAPTSSPLSGSGAVSGSPTAAPFRITNVRWDSPRRTGPTTAEPGTNVYVRITIEPRSANVNVSCRDLSTGKRLLFDIGSMYTCYIPNYDATAGKHTVQITVVEQETGYKQSKSLSFTLTAT